MKKKCKSSYFNKHFH